MICSFKHKLLFIAALTMVGMICAQPVLADDSTHTGYMKYEVHIGVRSLPNFTFSNFPLSNRSIPLNEGDDYLSGNEYMTEPLPDAQLGLKELGAIELTFLYCPYKTVAVGIIYGIHSAAIPPVDEPEYRLQQNQGGTPDRGYGTSLRYYYPYGDDYTQLGLTGELRTHWLKLLRWAWLRGTAGAVYDITGFDLSTMGGWDRWNTDTDWKSDRFAKMYEHRLFGTFTVGFPQDLDPKTRNGFPAVLQIRLYYQIPLYDLVFDSDAQDMIYEKTPNPRGGISFSLAF